MTVTEQEALFKQVKEKFSGMSNRWYSGYVAGVVDADKDRNPQEPDGDWEYTAGYRAGYIDAVGFDAVSVFPDFSDIDAANIDYRWWGK